MTLILFFLNTESLINSCGTLIETISFPVLQSIIFIDWLSVSYE
jgi:hypothetical protein